MRYLVLLVLAFLSQSAYAEDARCKVPVGRYQPKAGIIPNAQMAKAIAQIYLTAIYGAAQIRSELPLAAKLKNGVWLVQGRLPDG
ncbi:YbbC/YhhH family protein, partial [Klebsiella pneumoniae]|nr:YbbC/YhhH family protein [Klebsiella pneumoniae]